MDLAALSVCICQLQVWKPLFHVIISLWYVVFNSSFAVCFFLTCFTTLALVAVHSATFCFVDLAGGVIGGEAEIIVAGEMLTTAAGSELIAAGRVGRYLEATCGGSEADTTEDRGILIAGGVENDNSSRG